MPQKLILMRKILFAYAGFWLSFWGGCFFWELVFFVAVGSFVSFLNSKGFVTYSNLVIIVVISIS